MTLLKLSIAAISVLLSNILLGYTGTDSIISGGVTRTFNFYSPGASGPANNLPLLFMLHGDGGNGAGVESYTGMDPVADSQNFIVVYPDAVNTNWNRYADNVPGDAGLGDQNAPDDVQFISDLVDYFCTTYHINSSKVYASGHSAGGFMAYNLAVQLPGKIAAIAPVSASLWGDNTFLNNYFANSYTPIPVYHVHGDADGTVSYPDPNNNADAWGEWPLSGFSYPNCGNNTYTATTDVVAGSVKKISFCSSPKEVILIRIMGGDHGWPNVSGYNISLSIWNFLNTYSITTNAACTISTGIENTNKENMAFTIFPNPSQGSFTISETGSIKTIKAFDPVGKEIHLTKLNDTTFSFNSITSGIYFLKITCYNGTESVRKLIVE